MAREALEVLKECEAFFRGHFLLSSGRHSGAYCQMAFLQQYPDKAAEVMAPVAEKLKELNIDVVVGPLWAASFTPMSSAARWASAPSSPSVWTTL